MRQVKWIVLHHQAGQQFENRAALLAHSLAAGYSDIPYHFFIKANGQVIVGRPLEVVSAANLGVNREAVAICFGGNFDAADNPVGRKGAVLPTRQQIEAAGSIVEKLLKQFPGAVLIQHKDVVRIVPKVRLADGRLVSTATACPGSRFVDGQFARLVWHIACGHGVTQAYAKLEKEQGQKLHKYDAFVKTLPVIEEAEDELEVKDFAGFKVLEAARPKAAAEPAHEKKTTRMFKKED